jgi:hypothetical protein
MSVPDVTLNKPVILVTYNMSFASDKGMFVDETNNNNNFPSEMSFLKRIEVSDLDKRKYWKNAANLLKKFFDEKSNNALVIGLQEMNDTQTGTKTGTETTGTKYIEQQIVDKNNYNFAVDHLYVAETQQPALMTIWDKHFGNSIFNRIYELALKIIEVDHYYTKKEGYEDNYEDQLNVKTPLSIEAPQIKQSGRPIMFTYTDKGYLFINIQATNNAEDSANKYQIQLSFIQDKFELFKTELETKHTHTIDPAKIFVMGDFNDRYGGIGNKLLLSKIFPEYELKFDGKAPKSCCHNLDSSCKEEFYTVNKHEKNPDAKDCRFSDSFKLAGPRSDAQIELMDDNGNVENYRYVGDYCFALNGGNLKMYPERARGTKSIESDHEMVYMEVKESPSVSSIETSEIPTNINQNGGRRLKRNTKKGIPKKRRVSRKKRGSRRNSTTLTDAQRCLVPTACAGSVNTTLTKNIKHKKH